MRHFRSPLKPLASTFSVSVQGTDAGMMSKTEPTVCFVLAQSILATQREGKSVCTYSDLSNHLKSTCEQCRSPPDLFLTFSFSFPFLSFSKDEIHVPCSSSFSGLFESVG